MELFSIPSSASKFNPLQITTIRLLVANGVAWGVLPLAVTNIVLSQSAYEAVFNLCNNPYTRSRGNIANRVALQIPFAAALTSIYEKYLLNNPLITAADKLAMGIHDSVSTHASIPAPELAPLLTVSNGSSLQHLFKIRNSDTGRLARPVGVCFCEVWFKVGDPAPISLNDATQKAFLVKSGLGINFALSDKGKTVHYIGRWVSRKGVAGPWTDFFNGVVA